MDWIEVQNSLGFHVRLGAYRPRGKRKPKKRVAGQCVRCDAPLAPGHTSWCVGHRDSFEARRLAGKKLKQHKK